MASTLRLGRVVFVQPSAYGGDNRCLLDAMREVGPSARGVIGLDASATHAALREMEQLGVRGVRLNLASRGLRDAARIADMVRATAARIAPLGWHLQLFTDLQVIESLAETFRRSPVPIVIDHMGLAAAALGPAQPGFAALLTLLSRDAAGSSFRAAIGSRGRSRIFPMQCRSPARSSRPTASACSGAPIGRTPGV